MQHQPFHLRVSRKDATRELQAAAKIGQAIRGQRIRDMRDLDEARREKQEWLGRTMEVLDKLVSDETWCQQFNDFTATILPEYAEFGMFVDVFEEEMRHRLGRLQAFLKQVSELPEPGPLQRDPNVHRADVVAGSRAEIAQVLDAALDAQPDAAFADETDATQSDGRAEAGKESDADDEPQLETIYVPPEETMPQQQQQQLQQQQQQQQKPLPGKQTVAASILHDPEPHARPKISSPAAPAAAGAAMAPGGQSRGTLIVRAGDDVIGQNIAEFMEKLNVIVRVLDRRSPGDASLIDQLNSQSGSRFVLMLVDASQHGNADDLFDLGCCVGRMGPDRVFALHRGGDANTDRFGIAHVVIDETEGWQLTLARLLRKAGVSVDLNKLV
jgi:hypothetical protein